MKIAAYNSCGLSTGIRCDMGGIPHIMRLQRLIKLITRYKSYVDGQRHVRTWGLLRNLDKWVSFTLDFGQGGKAAAFAPHICIVRQKTSESYGLQRGAYERLADDVPFSQPTSI